MKFLILTITLRLASAHGSDRSHQLMIDFGRAVRKPDLVVAGAEHQPLEDEDIRDAIAALENGVRAAEDALATCAEDLYPSHVLEWMPEERDAYGAEYRRHLARFAEALRAYRDEFRAQAKRPRELRTTEILRDARARYVDLARQAHRDL